jgi:predicted metal-dependent peptidase
MAYVFGDVFGPRHDLSEECRHRIQVARVAMINKYPFFGIIATKLQLVEDNVRCQTLATDGKHMFYNVHFVMGILKTDIEGRAAYKAKLIEAFPDATPVQISEAMDGLTDGELRAGIIHEIMHCMFAHFTRRNNRNPKKWNRAGDYAINQLIVREKLGDVRKSWLYDPKYDFKSAEEIYPLLPDDPEGDAMDHHPDPDGSGAGDKNKGKKKGTVKDILDGTAPSDAGDEDGDGNNPGDLFDHVTPGELGEQLDDFKQTVLNAAQAAQVPDGIKRFLDDLGESKVDWRTKLRRTLQSYLKRDQSFQRPSRRSWNLGCVLPGFMPEETIDVCVALDMSGSISEDMARDFLVEVHGITKQFHAFKITLLCYDTEVYNPQEFDENNVKKLFEYQIHGGGGTSYECIFRWMKEQQYKPEQLINFTDLECYEVGDPDYCNTLFVVHSNPRAVAPYGQLIPYEFDA